MSEQSVNIVSIVDNVINTFDVLGAQVKSDELCFEFLDKVRAIITDEYNIQKYDKVIETIKEYRNINSILGEPTSEDTPVHRLCRTSLEVAFSKKDRVKVCLFMLLTRTLKTAADKDHLDKLVELAVTPFTTSIKDVTESLAQIKK